MTMDAMCEASIPAPGCLRHHPGQRRCGLSVLPPPRQPVSSSLGTEPHPDHPCLQPQTPHLEEDLKEVLRSEAGIELIIEDEVRPEKQKRKAGVSGWRGRGAGARSSVPASWGSVTSAGTAACHPSLSP